MNKKLIVNKKLVEPTTMEFNGAYDRVTRVVDWHSSWGDRIYFKNAVDPIYGHSVQLEIGEMAKCVTPMPDNRKLLFVGTVLGTLCVFERYSGGADGVYVFAATAELEVVLTPILDKSLSCNDIAFLTGGFYGGNVGTWLEKVVKLAADAR